MSLSVDTRLDSMALNSKRPREYIPTKMPEYLIKLKFDRQVKVEPERWNVYIMYYIKPRKQEEFIITSFYVIY